MEDSKIVFIRAEVVDPHEKAEMVDEAGRGFSRGNQLAEHARVVRGLCNVTVNLAQGEGGEDPLQRYGSTANWLERLAQSPSLEPLAEGVHDAYFLESDGKGGYTAFPTAGLPIVAASSTDALQHNFPEVAEALGRGEIVRITPLFGKDRSDVKDWRFLGC